jgi:periplasmic divalent cation tolerance protein
VEEMAMEILHEKSPDVLRGMAGTLRRKFTEWRGEIYERSEGRASLQTTRSRIPDIVARAKQEHPYEVPGVSARPIDGGNPEYLAWISEMTRPVNTE